MNYEQRMKIIAAAIAAETAVTIDKNLEKGILDGFYRIDSIEKQEQKALDPLMPFHVERIQEGYGIWNSGGYDEQRRLGKSIVAAGPDGERLRQVRYKKEVNGDHSLAVIYPGCYIAQSVAFDYYEQMIRRCIGSSGSECGTDGTWQIAGRCCGSIRRCRSLQRKRKNVWSVC